MSVSVHGQCLDGVKTVISALTLAGIAPASIVVRKLPTDRDFAPHGLQALPGIVISPAPGNEVEDQGTTNQTDDWGYPVVVTFVSAANQALAVVDAELLWRRQVRAAFHNLRPPALGAAVTGGNLKLCRVEPGPVIDSALFTGQNLTVSALTVRVVVRELRS